MNLRIKEVRIAGDARDGTLCKWYALHCGTCGQWLVTLTSTGFICDGCSELHPTTEGRTRCPDCATTVLFDAGPCDTRHAVEREVHVLAQLADAIGEN